MFLLPQDAPAAGPDSSFWHEGLATSVTLAQWMHAKSYSQRLDVQVETSDEWCASGVGTAAGAVQYLCGDMDSGNE